MRHNPAFYLLLSIALLVASVAPVGAATAAADPASSSGPPTDAPLMPSYDESGDLLLPEGFRSWVFVGSSLGLSYSASGGGHEMFHHTLMEPGAYAHFTETGEFRQGTMLALLLHGTGEGVLPSRRGRFAAEVHAVELAVKDSNRVDTGWAYYNFGPMESMRRKAQPFPRQSCYDCHLEHAAKDNVFLQFYPLLADVDPTASVEPSPAASPSHVGSSPQGEEAHRQGPAEAEPEVPVALGGLDPVHLVEGRREPGKPEIVMLHDGYRYLFASEPSRVRFEDDPERYSIRNETCLVVPGAPPRPELFAVHQGRIYIFATRNCVEEFEADPEAFVGETN